MNRWKINVWSLAFSGSYAVETGRTGALACPAWRLARRARVQRASLRADERSRNSELAGHRISAGGAPAGTGGAPVLPIFKCIVTGKDGTPKLRLNRNSRPRLMHFDFRKAPSNLLLKPGPGRIISVPEKNGAWIHPPDELHHVITIGMSC